VISRRPTHLQWLIALAGWTFFVWFQRIGNVLKDDELAGFAQVWRLGVAVVFVVVAVVLIGGVAIGRRVGGRETLSGSDSWVSTLGVGLAAVGSLWWVVRGGQILVGDWDLSFKAVHTVLAVVVVGLSVMVVRTRGYARPRYG
jgi:hypothetical protein